MAMKDILRREKQIWHSHFLPSLIAGIVVGIISFVFELTIANIILFASVGASAIILTNTHSHHLTKLRTTITAYIIAIIISSGVFWLNTIYTLHISLNIAILIFLVAMFLFLFDVFHPPAITASLSFIVLERPLIDLLYLFIAVILLLIVVRFLTYVISQRLPVKEFFQEFRKTI